jgi:hypothetical protein
MSFLRRLFGSGVKVHDDLSAPHEPQVEPPPASAEESPEPTTLPPALVEEIESLGFYMDETSTCGIAATRREQGPNISFTALWASKFKLCIGGTFVGGLGSVPGRWVLSIRGGLALNDSALRCPALAVAWWPRGSILCPPSRCADGAALSGASHDLDISPEVFAVAHLARGHAALDAPTTDLVRELLAPRIAELSKLVDSQVFFVVQPDGSCLHFGLCVYWAWSAPPASTVGIRSVETVVRSLDRWRNGIQSRAT